MEKVTPFYASVAIFNPAGEILLGKRKDNGIFTMPGGGGNEGETPEKAAVREAFEESGVAIDPRFLIPLPSIETRNGKLCHCFMYHCGRMDQMTTSKLDPDQEVAKWKWFSMDKLPESLREDPRRFESVRNAFMKYHGLHKSLTEELYKGGKPAAIGEQRVFGGKDYVKMGDGSWKPMPKPLDAKGKEKEVLVHPAKVHHDDLKNKAVLEGAELRSGKPCFTSIDAALAHGYTSADFKEASAKFYEKSQQMTENIEKLTKLKENVDPHMKKIAHEHMRLARAFNSQGNRVNERNVKTQQDQHNHVIREGMKKSVVMMGQADAAEIDTSKFAVENQISLQGDWYERIHNIMEGYQPGDEPRVIALDMADLYLVKVDDGMFSGVVKKYIDVEDSEAGQSYLVENAKIRIERMTIPSLIQFLIAKDYIKPYFQTVNEVAKPAQIESLVQVLEAPVAPVVPMPDENRAIRILELISRLV